MYAWTFERLAIGKDEIVEKGSGRKPERKSYCSGFENSKSRFNSKAKDSKPARSTIGFWMDRRSCTFIGSNKEVVHMNMTLWRFAPFVPSMVRSVGAIAISLLYRRTWQHGLTDCLGQKTSTLAREGFSKESMTGDVGFIPLKERDAALLPLSFHYHGRRESDVNWNSHWSEDLLSRFDVAFRTRLTSTLPQLEREGFPS